MLELHVHIYEFLRIHCTCHLDFKVTNVNTTESYSEWLEDDPFSARIKKKSRKTESDPIKSWKYSRWEETYFLLFLCFSVSRCCRDAIASNFSSSQSWELATFTSGNSSNYCNRPGRLSAETLYLYRRRRRTT